MTRIHMFIQNGHCIVYLYSVRCSLILISYIVWKESFMLYIYDIFDVVPV